MERNTLELLDIYIEMVEKQDEIICRMSILLKQYATELHHLRNADEFLNSQNERQNEALIQEYSDHYKNLRG